MSHRLADLPYPSSADCGHLILDALHRRLGLSHHRPRDAKDRRPSSSGWPGIGATAYLTSNKDRDLTAYARVRIGADGAPGPIEVVADWSDEGHGWRKVPNRVRCMIAMVDFFRRHLVAES